LAKKVNSVAPARFAHPPLNASLARILVVPHERPPECGVTREDGISKKSQFLGMNPRVRAAAGTGAQLVLQKPMSLPGVPHVGLNIRRTYDRTSVPGGAGTFCCTFDQVKKHVIE
jgi:hypothetical protein